MTVLLRKRLQRRGGAMVEMAVIIPVLVVFLLGSVEIGRAVMVKHVLEEAARAGCRVAVAEYSNKADVLEIVNSAMDMANLDGYTVTVSPDPPTELGPFETVTVNVSVPYTDVSWFAPSFMTDKTLTGVCVMPAESEGDEGPGPSGKKNKKNKSKSKSGKDGKDGKDGKERKRNEEGPSGCAGGPVRPGDDQRRKRGQAPP